MILENGDELVVLRGLIAEVRKTFRQLAGLSDEMLEERGLTASLRAILEHIADNGPSTVPQMAAAKSMKRQSIQALVDRLLAEKLVETVSNPEHKRSVLIALTEEGSSTFQSILAEERTLLLPVVSVLPVEDIRSAAQTLRELQAQLSDTRRGEHARDASTPV